MDPKITQEILDDLIPSLEALEVKSTAVLEFLKHEGITSEEKLTPYLEQAASASSVRWLGVRVRIERLLSSAEKDSAEKQTNLEDKRSEAAQTKPTAASQSDTEARDNPKSDNRESPNKYTDKNKKTEVTGAETEPKSNIATDDSTRNDNKGDAPEATEAQSQSTGAEQKVA